jgi:polygalacturonase
MDLRGYLQGEGANGLPIEDFCADQRVMPMRAERVSISDFGGIGDGKFLNTRAIADAIAYLESFGYGGGGGELHIPAGTWLTGSFNVTSHFTLFLDEGAVLLASQASRHKISAFRMLIAC